MCKFLNTTVRLNSVLINIEDTRNTGNLFADTNFDLEEAISSDNKSAALVNNPYTKNISEGAEACVLMKHLTSSINDFDQTKIQLQDQGSDITESVP